VQEQKKADSRRPTVSAHHITLKISNLQRAFRRFLVRETCETDLTFVPLVDDGFLQWPDDTPSWRICTALRLLSEFLVS